MKYSKHTVKVGDFVSIRRNDTVGYEVLGIGENVLFIREPVGGEQSRESSLIHGHFHSNLSIMYRLVDGLVEIG